VEGLAQRIVSGDVPDVLKTQALVALDLAALVQSEIPGGIGRPLEKPS